MSSIRDELCTLDYEARKTLQELREHVRRSPAISSSGVNVIRKCVSSRILAALNVVRSWTELWTRLRLVLPLKMIFPRGNILGRNRRSSNRSEIPGANPGGITLGWFL